ncbi:MAG: hypothetical protein K2X81_10250, partial [Candidatus Obscuribacterales bacterium]|nr:hypothetical protein [Candidatus Obscuribacterales bacterium]
MSTPKRSALISKFCIRGSISLGVLALTLSLTGCSSNPNTYKTRNSTTPPNSAQTSVRKKIGIGKFVSGPNMHATRYGHKMLLLEDGNILLVGGHAAPQMPEIYLTKSDTFVLANGPAEGHGSLDKNNHLLVNGYRIANTNNASDLAEFFIDPKKLAFKTGMMTLMPRFKVLGIGTASNLVRPALSGTARAQIYDIRTGGVEFVKDMTEPRARTSMQLLNDGRVLITGGSHDRTRLNSSEIFDPKTKTFQPGPPMTESRSEHTSVKLNDGRVLIIGGYAGPPIRRKTDPPIQGLASFLPSFANSAEIFDPRTNKFTKTLPMAEKRVGASAILLRDGRVLVTDAGEWGGSQVSEVFEPKSNSFVYGGSLVDTRANHAAIALPDG